MLSVLLFFIRAAASAFFIKKCVVSAMFTRVWALIFVGI